jgi:hypothetical protein
VFRLAFLPCLTEACVVGLVSHWLVGLPWLWSFMLGFVLAAVSPAVVVPCLLSLQDRGFGTNKVSRIMVSLSKKYTICRGLYGAVQILIFSLIILRDIGLVPAFSLATILRYWALCHPFF